MKGDVITLHKSARSGRQQHVPPLAHDAAASDQKKNCQAHGYLRGSLKRRGRSGQAGRQSLSPSQMRLLHKKKVSVLLFVVVLWVGGDHHGLHRGCPKRWHCHGCLVSPQGRQPPPSLCHRHPAKLRVRSGLCWGSASQIPATGSRAPGRPQACPAAVTRPPLAPVHIPWDRAWWHRILRACPLSPAPQEGISGAWRRGSSHLGQGCSTGG